MAERWSYFWIIIKESATLVDPSDIWSLNCKLVRGSYSDELSNSINDSYIFSDYSEFLLEPCEY